MKFLCPCGHIIRDQTDALPYKAHFIPDEDEEADVARVVEGLEAFFIARAAGRQEDFLRSYFGETYPINGNSKSIIADLLSGVIHRSARVIYECEICGRVFIQQHREYGKNVYGSYVPEEDIRNVLKSQRKQRE